jgi:hypothetical protein
VADPRDAGAVRIKAIEDRGDGRAIEQVDDDLRAGRRLRQILHGWAARLY